MQLSETSTTPVAHAAAKPASRPVFIAMGLASVALLAAGLAGLLSAAWGYALFVISGLALTASVGVVAMLLMSHRGRSERLVPLARALAILGAAAYVLAVAALAGHYTAETQSGRMELQWIIFGPLVLAALITFETGIYRKLVRVNVLSWSRYRMFFRRQDADPAAMRKTLVDEVVVHRSLWRVSKLRWLRHTLIFWGFGAMFLTELAAVLVREAMPAFGWVDVWRAPGHPVRLAFDLIFDTTGVMMLLGCLLALYWRISVRGKSERKFADTPMVLFLLFVVLTGFMIEGWRIAQTPFSQDHVYSFVGVLFGWGMTTAGLHTAGFHQPVWLVHVIASCALIAYLPATRLVHTCATPLGRLMSSQKGLLAAKKRGVLTGLMLSGPSPGRPSSHGATSSRKPI